MPTDRRLIVALKKVGTKLSPTVLVFANQSASENDRTDLIAFDRFAAPHNKTPLRNDVPRRETEPAPFEQAIGKFKQDRVRSIPTKGRFPSTG